MDVAETTTPVSMTTVHSTTAGRGGSEAAFSRISTASTISVDHTTTTSSATESSGTRSTRTPHCAAPPWCYAVTDSIIAEYCPMALNEERSLAYAFRKTDAFLAIMGLLGSKQWAWPKTLMSRLRRILCMICCYIKAPMPSSIRTL